MKSYAFDSHARPRVSIGIFAWNEEEIIARTLESLLSQSFFSRLCNGLETEVTVVLNGCTDNTAAAAKAAFARLQPKLPCPELVTCRVCNIPERGKLNAWNQFVHSVSASEATVLFMMDADIQIHAPETLWNMLRVLETDPEASVAVDQPCKHLKFQARKGWRDRLSLTSAEATLASEAQLCGQLYAIRAVTGRSIYLPKDLGACEDGYIKALVCTDLLQHEVWPKRLRVAPHAAHTFEAYTSPAAILKNQKRQIIGQTIVHLLVDKHHQQLTAAQRQNLAETLQRLEKTDPEWLKRRIAQHLREVRFCWRLYPGLLAQRFRALRYLRGWRRLKCLPSALAASTAAFLASWMAYRSLKSGSTHYWPKAPRLSSTSLSSTANPHLQST